MKKTEVSRRVVVSVLGAGFVGAVTSVAVGRTQARRVWRGVRAKRRVRGAQSVQQTSKAASVAQDNLAQRLFAPLVPGAQLDRWQVQRVLPAQNGAASIVLSDARGRQFQLDVCKRDRRQAAPVGPGRSELFEVFLANSGNGAKATFEDHGLAAMSLAEVIRSNEHRVSASSFMTLSERIARHGARVHLDLT